MKTQKNPGLGARSASIEAALAASRSSPPVATAKEASEPVVALSVRLPQSTYGALLDIVTEGKKRGEKISIHSLMLEGIAKIISEKK